MLFLNKQSIIYSIFLIMFHKTGKNRVQTTIHRTVRLEINKKMLIQDIWAASLQNQQNGMCAQLRLRSDSDREH